jgi:hypothetical protein
VVDKGGWGRGGIGGRHGRKSLNRPRRFGKAKAAHPLPPSSAGWVWSVVTERGWLYPHQSRHPPRRRGIHAMLRLGKAATGLWISACAEMTTERWRGWCRLSHIPPTGSLSAIRLPRRGGVYAPSPGGRGSGGGGKKRAGDK